MVEVKIKPKYVEKKDNPTEKVRNINITKVYFSEDDGKYIKGKICFFFFCKFDLENKDLNIWKYGMQNKEQQLHKPSTSININARVKFTLNYGDQTYVCVYQNMYITFLIQKSKNVTLRMILKLKYWCNILYRSLCWCKW